MYWIKKEYQIDWLVLKIVKNESTSKFLLNLNLKEKSLMLFKRAKDQIL